MSTPYDLLIGRLDGVRTVPSGGTTSRRARAYCPCHQPGPHRHGRAPSLSVAESLDGVVMVHCHAECSAQELLGAIGLDLGDLYPARASTQDGGRRGVGQGWIPAAALVDQAADLALAQAMDPDRTGERGLALAGLARQIREAGRAAARSMRAQGGAR